MMPPSIYPVKFASVVFVDRDVGLDVFVEVVFVPGFHFGDVPGPGEFAHWVKDSLGFSK
jgi:hypothetical protein